MSKKLCDRPTQCGCSRGNHTLSWFSWDRSSHRAVVFTG